MWHVNSGDVMLRRADAVVRAAADRPRDMQRSTMRILMIAFRRAYS